MNRLAEGGSRKDITYIGLICSSNFLDGVAAWICLSGLLNLPQQIISHSVQNHHPVSPSTNQHSLLKQLSVLRKMSVLMEFHRAQVMGAGLAPVGPVWLGKPQGDPPKPAYCCLPCLCRLQRCSLDTRRTSPSQVGMHSLEVSAGCSRLAPLGRQAHSASFVVCAGTVAKVDTTGSDDKPFKVRSAARDAAPAHECVSVCLLPSTRVSWAPGLCCVGLGQVLSRPLNTSWPCPHLLDCTLCRSTMMMETRSGSRWKSECNGQRCQQQVHQSSTHCSCGEVAAPLQASSAAEP